MGISPKVQEPAGVQRSMAKPVSETVVLVHWSRMLVEFTAVAVREVGAFRVVRMFAVAALAPLWQVVVSGQPVVPVL